MRQSSAPLKAVSSSSWRCLDENKHALASMSQFATRYVQPVASGGACMLGLLPVGPNTRSSMYSKHFMILATLFCKSVCVAFEL